MAGSSGVALAVAVARAGGLGSLPAAMLTSRTARGPDRGVPAGDRRAAQRQLLLPRGSRGSTRPARVVVRVALALRRELGVVRGPGPSGPPRLPFDDDAVPARRTPPPRGGQLPLRSARAGAGRAGPGDGAVVMSSATTVAEAIWLESHGCDVVIAQGAEAGGHRGMFLTTDVAPSPARWHWCHGSSMPSTCRSIAAAASPMVAASPPRSMLGASAVQIGTAYLLCPEALTSTVHRRALDRWECRTTRCSRTSSPADPLVGGATGWWTRSGRWRRTRRRSPLAGGAVAPLRAAAESVGSGDFSPLWSGEAGVMTPDVPAGELTRSLMADARDVLTRTAGDNTPDPGSARRHPVRLSYPLRRVVGMGSEGFGSAMGKAGRDAGRWSMSWPRWSTGSIPT